MESAQRGAVPSVLAVAPDPANLCIS
jgi:hypothetical protein